MMMAALQPLSDTVDIRQIQTNKRQKTVKWPTI